ncbi:hypothetical protein [Cryobacterium tepidiphilum]|uniref:Uncharacterized protein n=1 Tax=Cryobacterium tepidiphilum TaxID=2486026 RepID=A0A3M8LPJ9_9MICO|nr:hypothetical protein [Cryobacterium tepidiphilum]RNE67301.1 hypothetical protein EEJ31_00520 [Cryobacterium tepidiphilum]
MTLTAFELLRVILGLVNFLLVLGLSHVLNSTFPRGRGGPLPPWRLVMAAAIVVSFALFGLALWDLRS